MACKGCSFDATDQSTSLVHFQNCPIMRPVARVEPVFSLLNSAAVSSHSVSWAEITDIHVLVGFGWCIELEDALVGKSILCKDHQNEEVVRAYRHEIAMLLESAKDRVRPQPWWRPHYLQNVLAMHH